MACAARGALVPGGARRGGGGGRRALRPGGGAGGGRAGALRPGKRRGRSPTAPAWRTGWTSCWTPATGELAGVARRAVRSGVLILVIVLLCALADSLYGGTGRLPVPASALAGTLAVAVVAVGDVHSLMGLGRETIAHMTSFSNVLLPAVAAATAATGAAAGGGRPPAGCRRLLRGAGEPHQRPAHPAALRLHRRQRGPMPPWTTRGWTGSPGCSNGRPPPSSPR